ncbi:hypothetical protein L226DRAFT_459562 [Lentinus tigrinus ALCF2SS1-7]|uniref:uncharacterized protein n=1 Tax=Lentinus tigrinus ALCF2SS1-7 TaxID=1328758 RepID=UPI001165CFDE|nr:hypothetical protein L226DRAFT_459562 [Lentinus tigrinus ALCF2SS1-7]
MSFFSGKIRSKPNWWEKVNDPSIVAKWREEMVEQDRVIVHKLWGGKARYTLENHGQAKKWPRGRISNAQLDYIFEQLKYEAAQRDPETGIFATSIYRVHESRSLIPPALKDDLLKGVALLENVPEDQKDWHPGSNKQVLDLVHPSLYCLRIGETLFRADATNDESLEVLTWESYSSEERRPDIADFMKPWNRHTQYAVSQRYQWLPTDFQVSPSGDATPLAYINNLHPTRHATLYPIIASILARFIPLFERVLSDMLSPEPPHAITVDPFRWYKHEPEPPDWEEREEYEAWERKYHWPRIPKPAPFTPPDTAKRVEYPLKNRKVQVIVKLANIILTPENPTYAGGTWHVEGMANENIVATGLYYYTCENITESRLDFRVTLGGVDMRYQQDDHLGHVVAYGFGRGHQQNQNVGHIVAEEDKCVAFPNIYQHRVDAFELADPTKPGYRKILCFFLVNPNTEILSTTDVPPQQEDWLEEEMKKIPAMGRLPVELVDMITSYAKQDVMSREEAEGHRAALMEERSNFVLEHNESIYEVKFNLCEH